MSKSKAKLGSSGGGTCAGADNLPRTITTKGSLPSAVSLANCETIDDNNLKTVCKDLLQISAIQYGNKISDDSCKPALGTSASTDPSNESFNYGDYVNAYVDKLLGTDTKSAKKQQVANTLTSVIYQALQAVVQKQPPKDDDDCKYIKYGARNRLIQKLNYRNFPTAVGAALLTIVITFLFIIIIPRFASDLSPTGYWSIIGLLMLFFIISLLISTAQTSMEGTDAEKGNESSWGGYLGIGPMTFFNFILSSGIGVYAAKGGVSFDMQRYGYVFAICFLSLMNGFAIPVDPVNALGNSLLALLFIVYIGVIHARLLTSVSSLMRWSIFGLLVGAFILFNISFWARDERITCEGKVHPIMPISSNFAGVSYAMYWLNLLILSGITMYMLWHLPGVPVTGAPNVARPGPGSLRSGSYNM